MILNKLINDVKNVEKKFYYLFLTLFFKTVINFLFLFYIAKVVSLSDFGNFTFSFVIMTIWILFIDYGYNLHALVFDFKDENSISDSISSIISGKVFISIVLVLSLFFLLTPAYSEYRTIVLILSIAAIPSSFGNFFFSLFKAKNQYKYETVGFVLQGGLLLFLLLINNYFGRVDIITFSYIVLFTKLVYFIYAYSKFRITFHVKFRLSLKNALSSYKGSLSYGVHLIFGTLVLYFETLFLSYFTDMEVVGYYQAGLRLIMAASLFGAIITDGFVPEISRKLSEKQFVANKMENLFMFLGVFYFLLLLTLGFYFNTVLQILFDTKFIFIEKYSIYILLIILTRAIAIVPGIILTSTGLQKIRAKTVIYSSILSVILNIILVPLYGIEGAFISFLATNILLTFMYVYFSIKKIKFVKIIATKIVVILFIYFVLQYMFSIDNKLYLFISILVNLIIQLLAQKSLKNKKVYVTN